MVICCHTDILAENYWWSDHLSGLNQKVSGSSTGVATNLKLLVYTAYQSWRVRSFHYRLLKTGEAGDRTCTRISEYEFFSPAWTVSGPKSKVVSVVSKVFSPT
jgi:hypothetical protein